MDHDKDLKHVYKHLSFKRVIEQKRLRLMTTRIEKMWNDHKPKKIQIH